jgi:hypothetical protein
LKHKRLDELAVGPCQEQTGKHGEGSSPAEIEQGLGRNILRDAGLQLGRNGRHRRRLHEVEIVKKADPGDPEEDVQPLKNAVHEVARRRAVTGIREECDEYGERQSDNENQPQVCEEFGHLFSPFSLANAPALAARFGAKVRCVAVSGLNFSRAQASRTYWGGGSVWGFAATAGFLP